LTGIQGVRRQFLERTQANAIGLAQSAINRSSFSHSHLGVIEDQRRNIAGMSIAIADET
jgi:hypothetical protein